MSNVEDIFAPESRKAPEANAPLPEVTGYVVCDLDRMVIAIPQTDVVAIEHGGELAAPMPGESAFGWFASSQGPWPVYALSDQLQLTQQPSSSRSFVVFLKSQPWPRGLLAQAVRIVGKKADLPVQALPYPLCATAPGISGVARIDAQRLLYVFEPGKVIGLLADVDSAQERKVLYA